MENKAIEFSKRVLGLLLAFAMFFGTVTPAFSFANGANIDEGLESSTFEEIGVSEVEKDVELAEDLEEANDTANEPPILRVVFDPNGGVTPAGNSERLVSSNNNTLWGSIGNANMPLSPTRQGFAFGHWNTEENPTPENPGIEFRGTTTIWARDMTTPDDPFRADANGVLTVYAQWGHEVRFFGNGVDLWGSDTTGTAADRTNQHSYVNRVVDDGWTVEDTPGMVWPVDPVRAGARFDGWFDTPAAEGGNRFDGTTPINAGVTLFARWELNPIVTVTFSAYPHNLVTNHTPTREAYTGMSLWQSSNPEYFEGPHTGDHLNQDAVPLVGQPWFWSTTWGLQYGIPLATRTNWTFMGWNTESGMATNNFNNGIAIYEDMIVYAAWAHHITFNLNGGLVGTSTASQHRFVPASGNTVDEYGFAHAQDPNVVGMPPVTRSGHTLVGWTTGGANSTDVNFDGTTPVNGNVMVWAVWELTGPPHTLTFHSNGGTALTNYVRSIPYNARMIDMGQFFPTHPTREGHAFMGWYTAPNFEDGTLFTRQTAITADTNVYARWVPSHNITIHMNGGNMGLDNTVLMTHTVGSGMTINQMNRVNAGTTTGYTTMFIGLNIGWPWNTTESNHRNLLGWNTRPDGSGTVVTANTVITEDMTFYAVWTGTVTFNTNTTFLNPGLFDQTTTRVVATGRSIRNHHLHPNTGNAPLMDVTDNWPDLSATAISTGHAFYRWNTQRDGYGTWFDDLTVVTGNITVYAVWYQGVTFQSGFAPADLIIAENKTRRVDFGFGLGSDMPPNPESWEVNGVVLGEFAGWNTASNGQGTAIDENFPITGSMTLFAIWNITVTLDGNGGDLVASHTVWQHNAGNVMGTWLPTANINTPTREGHIFAGWSTAPDREDGFNVVASTPISHSMRIYAQWNSMATFNHNFVGGPANLTRTVQSGTAIGATNFPADPTREGYTFVEWNTAADGQGTTVDETTLIDGATTVYAIWQSDVLEGHIFRLVIDRFEGGVDQVERTITFRVPNHLINDDSFGGIVTDFEAGDAEELIFFVGEREWLIEQGDLAAFSTGDLVYVEDGVEYRLIIEPSVPCEKRITELVIDRFEGEIDQDAETITFRVPSHLLNDSRFGRVATSFETDVDADELIFFTGEREWLVGQGGDATFSTGDLVYVENGIVYTLIIEEESGVVQITQLVIDQFEGVIDQEERTITFWVPSYLVDNGRFSGVITEFEANGADELIFFAGGGEWFLRVGDTAGFVTGDLVYVVDGIFYRLIIEEEPIIIPGQITRLAMSRFEGAIDQDEATITLRIPSHLLTDGLFRGYLDFEAGDADELIFSMWEAEFPFREGDAITFYSGILVRVEDGMEYTLIIESFEPTEGRVTQLTIDGFEGEIDQEERTITLRIPSHLLTDDLFRGIIEDFATDVDADDLIFFMWGVEFPFQAGDAVTFASGAIVSILDGIPYTLIIEETGDTECPTIAEGRFANQSAAQGGRAGSSWRLCENGTLEIDEGFINWTLYNGPWHNYRNDITDIVIAGPITAGTSLRSLFRGLDYVAAIEGLTYFDTSNTRSMQYMFRTSTGIVRLNLSSFDSSNVTNMHRMFTNMHALEYVDFGENFIPSEDSGLPARLRP